MGGNVVLNFAFAHQERVSALILADTGAGSDDAARMVARALQGAEVHEHDGIEAYADWALTHPAEACIPPHAFMGRTIPNAAHHVLPSAGHLTNLEAAEAFNRLVVEFLNAHVARFS
jgi:pimeloyl-ACP methyl ester carboxylesterase